MKRFLVVLLGLLALSLAPRAAQASFDVFACFPEWAALAKQLGGDRVEVFQAVDPLMDPDHVSVTPAMIGALKQADLLVCTGGGFERHWLPDALERARNPKLAKGQPGLFFAADFIRAEEDDHGAGSSGDGHQHAHGNPHVQGGPKGIRAIAGRLGRRLIDIDSANADVYGANTKAFVAELGKVIGELEQKAAPLRGINVIASHQHSTYLFAWLGMNVSAVIERDAGRQADPAALTALAEKAARDNARFVVHAAYEDPRASRFVAERAGIALVNLPFTVGGTDDAHSFADFYRSSVERLLDGLAGRDRP